MKKLIFNIKYTIMSKFLNTASLFNETEVFKKKYLYKTLELYNEHILLSSDKSIDNKIKYIIPNNSNKYYMLIVNNTCNKYSILYFFPNQNNIVNNLNKHIFTDFYVEIDSDKAKFDKNNYLFEGYFYNNNNEFLITDILSVDSQIIKCSYSLRYSLINKIMENKKLHNLNGNLNINIHSIFKEDIDNSAITELFTIFKNNFIYKNEINSIEYIDESSLQKTKVSTINKLINSMCPTCPVEIKEIHKGKYVDVYNVNNIQTNNSEGILYIKTINSSKKLRELFLEKNTIKLKCEFNYHFNKWYVTDFDLIKNE